MQVMNVTYGDEKHWSRKKKITTREKCKSIEAQLVLKDTFLGEFLLRLDNIRRNK